MPWKVTTMESDNHSPAPDPVEAEGPSQNAHDIYAASSPVLSWQTRILALHPGERGDPLAVDLQLAVITHKSGLGIVAEDRNEEYEALSYTWGSQEFTHPLVCNGHPMKITENLYHALQRLRRREGKRYIWADAVCINQQDNVERARQVRNLQVIFERARRVIVWLGRATQHTKKAIDFVTLLTSQAYRLDTNMDTEKVWHEVDARLEVKKLFQGAQQGAISSVLQGLLDLAQRAWMRRSWVIQEIHAASSVSVRCGPCSIPWRAYTQIHNALRTALWYSDIHQQRPQLTQQPSYFALPRRNKIRAMHILSVHRALQSNSEGDSGDGSESDSAKEEDVQCASLSSLRSLCGHQINSIRHAMDYLRARGPARSRDPRPALPNRSKARKPEPHAPARELNRILLESGHLRAQDDRDRIFALLGLTSVPTSYGDEPDVGSNGIAINYDRSASLVYQNAAKFFINKCQHLGPLYYKWTISPSLDEHSGDLRPLELPSWTPDWRQVDQSRYLDAMQGALNHPWDQLMHGDIDLHLSCMYDKPKLHYDRAMRSSLPHWPGTYFVHPQNLSIPDVLQLHGRKIGQVIGIADADHSGMSRTIQVHHSGVMNMWIMKSRAPRSLPTYSQVSRQEETQPVAAPSTKRERQAPAEKNSPWIASTKPELNDILATVFGGLVPLILRERADTGYYCVGYAVPNQKIGKASMLDLVSSSLLTVSGLAIDEFNVY